MLGFDEKGELIDFWVDPNSIVEFMANMWLNFNFSLRHHLDQNKCFFLNQGAGRHVVPAFWLENSITNQHILLIMAGPHSAFIYRIIQDMHIAGGRKNIRRAISVRHAILNSG